MRGKSHICLGHYLIDHYMQDLSPACAHAFLFGCIQPDRNPATYFKGSVRHQWLRGHNYRNARRFMSRISRRLEQKQQWNLFDYYTLGKLIHYTADSFTYAHNHTFPEGLREHRDYEIALQEHFLSFLQLDPQVDIRFAKSIMDTIGRYHREYLEETGNISRDSHFALQACCCVLAILITPRMI